MTVGVGPSAYAGHAPRRHPKSPVSSDDLLTAALAKVGVDWFAGLYKEGRSTVVLTTRRGVDKAQLTKAAWALVEAGLLSSKDKLRTVRVVPAKYAFGQLNAWKKPLERDFFALKGAVLVDLDEKADRILLGYDAKTLPKKRVQALVQRAGVPPDAVEIRSVEPIVPQGLRDRAEILAGGVQVHNANLDRFCTLGFTAYRNGVEGFVTSDHCTRTTGQVDGDLFYQPWAQQFGWRVGQETVDPPLDSGWPCFEGHYCRYSDAAFIALNAPSTYGPGFAASMDALNDPDAWTGQVRELVSDGVPAPGTPIFKIGAGSGKNEGTITNTCLNVASPESGIPELIRLCQDWANYINPSRPGDSGAPVLGYDEDRPPYYSIFGIHWGSDGLYSRIDYVYDEVGPLVHLWN